MFKLVCIVIGYFIGCIQSAYIVGKFNHKDIRKYGSGNLGTTNALRVLGKKAGFVTFVCDIMKAVIAFVICYNVFGKNVEAGVYAGLGVVLGHDFPFYLGFKGGKGIASMAGLLVSMDWRVTLVCAAVFLGTVIITRYVSLGSIFVVILFFIQMVLYESMGAYQVAPGSRLEFYALAGVLTGMAIWRHRANIRRLLAGTENKLWGNKKKS